MDALSNVELQPCNPEDSSALSQWQRGSYFSGVL